ncbi:ABC transporter substrate-binding protein [Bradyrhizobium arachidis]|uniref:ABC transporter substrate-binding protein n=1 Tax=Bradyrhizobium arachidis TaxID=858423 RepID=UPI00142D84C5|nr:ABC transporter substrate-binding protein [Bradyrhizobium arachidis]
MKRVAMVHPTENVGNMTLAGRRFFRGIFEQLAALGYVEGRNLLVERYSGQGVSDHYAELARDVVKTQPDVILSIGGQLTEPFKAATATIPIVTTSADPVFVGLVPSIARPGGNITGVSVDAGLQIWGKRLEVLSEARPRLTNARFLASRRSWDRVEGPAVREAAKQLRISLEGALLASPIGPAAYRDVFGSMAQEQVDAIVVSTEAEHISNRAQIVGLAAEHRIAAIYPFREFTDAGGLLAYSVDLGETGRQLANMIDKILKGAKPGDVPVLQQVKFELIVNLRTAKALRLDIPAKLVARADEVIE